MEQVRSENYSKAELAVLRDYIVVNANELAEQMERDADGYLIYKGDMNQAAVEAMQQVGTDYGRLQGYYPQPKEIYFSELLSQTYRMGYYFPFSMEANYNGTMYIVNKPSVICHEFAHLKGFMQEDEANLIGYLAKGREAYEFIKMLYTWKEQADKLSSEEINREEYDNWRYHYPKFDTTQIWAKVPSKELSDALVEAFKDKLTD